MRRATSSLGLGCLFLIESAHEQSGAPTLCEVALPEIVDSGNLHYAAALCQATSCRARNPELHEVPKYTESRRTRSRLCSESQPYSLKTMKGLLEKPWSNTQSLRLNQANSQFLTLPGDLSHLYRLPWRAWERSAEDLEVPDTRGPKTCGSSQSTEWISSMSEPLDLFTYYEYHLLFVQQ
jgi:hypothetical protein